MMHYLLIQCTELSIDSVLSEIFYIMQYSALKIKASMTTFITMAVISSASVPQSPAAKCFNPARALY